MGEFNENLVSLIVENLQLHIGHLNLTLIDFFCRFRLEGHRQGTVGGILPGMEYRLEPVPGIPAGGKLLVRGPNVMRGYLNAEANAAFQLLGGWYDTGDLARIDDDGFVFLLGRMKRFAKISGEMVSLTAVEDALAGAFPQHGLRCEIAVVAVADEEKGEKLIAICNVQRLSMDEVRQAIKAKGVSMVLECGPGKVLAGMVKRIDADMTGLPMFDPASLAEAKGALA